MQQALWRSLVPLLLLPPLLWAPEAAAAGDLAGERHRFVVARDEIKAGRMTSFRQLAATLRDYPLHPYLEYWELRRVLGSASDERIEGFLDRYKDSPLSYRLRGAWLESLARRQRWDKFIDVYDGRSDTRLQCQELRARIAGGTDEELLDDIEAMWTVGRSQPDECDPAFDLLYASERMTPELLWTRITLAMERGNLRLARFLGKKLPPGEQHWVELWVMAHRRPETALADDRLSVDDEHARAIVRHAVRRAASSDAARARRLWMRIDGDYSFSPEELAATDEYVALRAAYQHLEPAQQWLEELGDEGASAQVRIWKVRTALRNRDWPGLILAIEALSEGERRSSRWRYWMARSLEQTGRTQEAEAAYRALATEQGYYAFLAADRLGLSYRLVSEAVVEPSQRGAAARLLEIPGILRARELFMVGMEPDARREWYLALSRLSPDEIRLAAILADEWRWHDNAIITVARTGHWNDLDLRFPTPYRSEILRSAEDRGIDPAWVYGIMRRESAFMSDAKSSAGALGLMQLLPSTARTVSRSLGLRRPGHYDLLEPDRNITLGSAYLRQVLDRFDQHLVLATAAYNAGPAAVRRWLPEEELAADLWVDTVPYHETRDYVSAVMGYTTIFDWKLDDDVTPLRQRMPGVTASPTE